MKLHELSDHIDVFCISTLITEQAQKMLDNLYDSQCVSQREADIPGNSEYVPSDAYYNKQINEQIKLIEDNTIEKIFEKEFLSQEEIEVLYYLREHLIKINDDFRNPIHQTSKFLKLISLHPVFKNVELTKAISEEICNAGKYICDTYMCYNVEKDVFLRKRKIEDIFDELVSICPNLKTQFNN